MEFGLVKKEAKPDPPGDDAAWLFRCYTSELPCGVMMNEVPGGSDEDSDHDLPELVDSEWSDEEDEGEDPLFAWSCGQAEI